MIRGVAWAAAIGAAVMWLGAGCGGDDGATADAAPPADAPSVIDAASVDAVAVADAPPAEARCPIAPGEGVSFDLDEPACERLSSYRFFSGPGSALIANTGVIPYDVNTPLFSDYSTKHRYLWLPPDSHITYTETGTLDFPVGAVIIKSFGYLADIRDPQSELRQVETRLLVHRADGWEGVVYEWNEDQTDALFTLTGGVVPVSWIDAAGDQVAIDYTIPNVNQCKGCHEQKIDDADVMGPIGPSARQLNRDFAYATGPENQLTHLAAAGALMGAPADPASAPKLPVWDDPESGTVAERARAYLEANCAHCHNPEGPARVSGLDLQASQTDPYAFGVCKPPVAAGPGAGDRDYAIVPGMPDASILVYRLESTEPEIMMPELLKTVAHAEGVALVRQWITEMAGTCDAPAPSLR
ncbi:MAG TPA: SO2930 family diheme c-type cytochrome [Kofleriaceae bacterium]|nr:SO2930 family diheme c-type cytochrome [Kofleriaceae bacterium]